MNGMRISSNNNNFNLQYSNNQRYNTFKNPNLMSYENSMNLINQSYNRENEIYNNINNINEQEKEKEQLPQEEDEPIIPERSLCDYINNNFLSDAVLKLNDIELYFHKIVLIACSDYLNNYFISIKDKIQEEKPPEEKPENEENNEIKPKENKYQDKIVVDFPEIISSSFGGGNKKNCLEKILKYCYSNQNFKSIESDINQYNIFTLLELAHSLGIKSLKSNLEKKIIKNHLGKDNATKLAIESKIFDLKKLNKECTNYIIQYFKDVKIFKNDIMALDFETFKNIMNSDSINIETEKDISDFVLNYIKSRRDLPEEEKEEKPEIKEEQIKQNENENNEKNKNIEENNEEKANNEEEKKEDEKKEENEIKEIKEENNENEKWKKYLYELKDSTKRKKLNNEQEKELIMCIRFAFLPHYELNKLINEPVMNDFKDILLQALSLKLNSYETQNIENNNNIFNSKPRLCYKTNENINNNMNNNMEFELQNNYDMVNYNQSMPNLQTKFYNKNKNSFNQSIPNNPMYRSMNRNNYNHNYIPNKNEEEYKNDNINNYNEYDNDNNENNNNNYYNINQNQNQNEFDENNENISEDESSINNNKIKAEYFNINNSKEKEKINRYQKMLKSEKNDKKPTHNQNKEINESISSEGENKSKNGNQSNISRNYNPKFKYKSDFDHNGALYYIGTLGLTKNYENPHKLKLIKAFGSSLLSGNFSDFVGRKYTNLSTENEENSFFGVDLGPNRYLIPTSYSLKNRDSDTNVLLCWNFQGSNDKINFEILDKRIFMSETDEKLNDKTRKYRHLLKKPKTTSTWGVSKKIREKYPNGFRYFLLKQIGKNSSKNYNLTISGFEIYGEGIGSGWIFN